ncbi:uncharacterized protein LOC135846457 [Planococcus citri]|uniref:uncharacterized protein LOC135846457 n=1 Tax=Planococcus citri TaxID=170843 RepID=UPI0031FA0E12
MLTQTVPMVIITVITFSLIIKQIHCESDYDYEGNETEIENDFVCEKVITDIGSCMAGRCSTDNVAMLKKCNSFYDGAEDIKRKCEDWPTDEDQLQNTFLTLPAIGAGYNIVYWNMYCALCNYHYILEFGTPISYYTIIEQCQLAKYYNFNSAEYRSFMGMSEHTNTTCNFKIPRVIRKSSLKPKNYCNQTSDSSDELLDPVHHKYCNTDPSTFCPKLPFRNDLLCSYGSDRTKLCTTDWFILERMNFAYGEYGNVFVPSLSMLYPEYSSSQYTNQTGTKGLLYICGEEEKYGYPLKLIGIVSYIISMVFLILCVIINSNKQSLQNLPNRTLYSFCISQLIYSFFRLNNEFPMIDGTCIIINVMFMFADVSTSSWAVVIFFEYTCLIYCLIRSRRISTKVQMKKYLAYCTVCWVLPTILTMVAMFSIFTNGEKSPSSCPKIKHYSLIFCGYQVQSNQYTELLYQINDKLEKFSAVVFTLGLVAVPLAMIYLRKQNTTTSTSNRNYFIIYVKIMLAMSAHFVFHMIMLIVSSDEGKQTSFEVFEMFDGFLGVLIFFLFYFKKSMLNNVLMMLKLRKSSADNVEMKGVTN